MFTLWKENKTQKDLWKVGEISSRSLLKSEWMITGKYNLWSRCWWWRRRITYVTWLFFVFSDQFYFRIVKEKTWEFMFSRSHSLLIYLLITLLTLDLSRNRRSFSNSSNSDSGILKWKLSKYGCLRSCSQDHLLAGSLSTHFCNETNVRYFNINKHL